MRTGIFRLTNAYRNIQKQTFAPASYSGPVEELHATDFSFTEFSSADFSSRCHCQP